MTPKTLAARVRAVERYLRTLAPHLGLSDWYLIVSDKPAADDAWAEVTPSYGKNEAVIKVATDFWDLPPGQQREVLVHELIHCHLNRVRVAAAAAFDALGPVAGPIAKQAVTDAVEYATDAMAVVWARKLPPPPWSDAST